MLAMAAKRSAAPPQDLIMLLSASDVSTILTFLLLQEGGARSWAAFASTCKFTFAVATMGGEEASRMAAMKRSAPPACFPSTHKRVHIAKCARCTWLMRMSVPSWTCPPAGLPGWHAANHEEENRRMQLERHLGAALTRLGEWGSIRATQASAKEGGREASVVVMAVGDFLTRRNLPVKETAHRVRDVCDLMGAYRDAYPEDEDDGACAWELIKIMLRKMLRTKRRNRCSAPRWAWFALGGADGTLSARASALRIEVRRQHKEAELRAEKHAAAAMGGKIYLTGGGYTPGSSVNSAYVYDPQADAWTQLASMSTARQCHASAAVGGKLYVFGGLDAGGRLSTAEVYDPASNSWAQVTSLTSARHSLGVVAL